MDKDEDMELVLLAKEGDMQAKAELYEKHKDRVRKMARYHRRYLGNYLLMEDHIQAGYIGLLAAIEKFDPDAGAAFSTYADYWIREEIQNQIYAQGFIGRVSARKMKKIAEMHSLDYEFKSLGLNLKERLELIAEKMKITVAQVEELMVIDQNFLRHASLDTPVGEEGDIVLGDLIPEDGAYDPEKQAFRRELAAEMEKVISTLTMKEQKVIRLLYGFVDGNQHDYGYTAKKLGESTERVRKLEAKAMQKLRHPLRRAVLEPFYNSNVA